MLKKDSLNCKKTIKNKFTCVLITCNLKPVNRSNAALFNMLLLPLKNARIITIQNNKQPVGVVVGLAVGKPVVGVALGLAKCKDRA